MTVHRTGLITAEVSWNSDPLYHYIYEVFYQVAAGGNNVSGGNTSSNGLTLTGLTLGKMYAIFVVAFFQNGTVLPSARSKIVRITLSKCMVVALNLRTSYNVYNRHSTTEYSKTHYQHKCIYYCVGDSY